MEINEAVKFFIEGKRIIERSIDVLSKKKINKILLRALGIQIPSEVFLKDYNIAITPRIYVSVALPFSYRDFESYPYRLEAVNPFYVVGGTYNKGYNIDGAQVESTLEKLNALAERNNRYVGDPAMFDKIGKLPLYIAREGKNRISAYRHSRKDIKAFTTLSPFPEPESLLVRPGLLFNLYFLECNGTVEVLPFSEFVLPLLLAYGVKIGEPVSATECLFRIREWREKRQKIMSSLMAS